MFAPGPVRVRSVEKLLTSSVALVSNRTPPYPVIVLPVKEVPVSLNTETDPPLLDSPEGPIDTKPKLLRLMLLVDEMSDEAWMSMPVALNRSTAPPVAAIAGCWLGEPLPPSPSCTP